VLRRIFGAKRDKVMGSGENFIMRSLMFFGLQDLDIYLFRHYKHLGHALHDP
jgi:hypothetical protein